MMRTSMIFGALLVVTSGMPLESTGPCDIYDAAGTPCVAAHSMTRALYSKYSGPLYTVKTADGSVKDIMTATTGGVADSASQDEFCSGKACTVDRIWDQSPMGNHLTVAPPGGAHRAWDNQVNATREQLSMGGNKVYSAVFEGGNGYRREATKGIAKNDEPESMYAVFAGKHYNGGCCFDYGNAEIDAIDHGAGTMEAIYWGNSKVWGRGAGDGPWVMADLENGLWAGDNRTMPQPPLVADFVLAMVKGNSGNQFALKGGDAQKGPLNKLYEGGRPNGYHPMKKQGAIILGIGGDNSDSAIGTFYEGVMVSGYTSDETDDKVMANVIEAKYGR